MWAIVGTVGAAGCASDDPALAGAASATDPIDQAGAADPLDRTDEQPAAVGIVYAATNDTPQNGVVRYRRLGDGRLEFAEIAFTQGTGTGSKIIPDLTMDGPDPLFAQHSLALTADHRTVLVVNAGDDTVTAFRAGPLGALRFVNRVASGGHFPNSIAIRGDAVYVTNFGNPVTGPDPSITRFRITASGALQRIPGGEGRFSDPGALPAHALFSPDGHRLVVSERGTGRIAVFPIERDGALGPATFNPSIGANPFGMVFASDTTLIVSEVQGIVLGAASVSTYRLHGTELTPITRSLANGQTASCWLSLAPDRRFVYASNTFGTGDISIYAVAPSGQLSLVEGAAVPRPPAPGQTSSGLADSLISADGRYLYQSFSGRGEIGAFRIHSDGRLSPVANGAGDGTGLPALGSEGLDGF